MKTQTPEVNIPISSKEIETLKTVINNQWDTFYSIDELIADIEQGFIFGKYAINKHYLKSFILNLIKEVELEKITLKSTITPKNNVPKKNTK